MKQLFLRSVRIEEHTEERENIVYKENEQGEAELDMFEGWYDDYDSHEVKLDNIRTEHATGFNMEDYESEVNKHTSTVKTTISNIDGFRKYSLDTECVVTHKEARTAIEEKRPFIVAKRGKKLGMAEEVDTIYKTLPKMKISNKNVQRIGFLIADERATQCKLKDKKKYRGIANDEFLITKKKGFNQKKIGYLPLEETTATKDLYVEVTTNRGYKWLIVLLLIICLICLFIATRDLADWHFNKNGLTFYKTKEITEFEENELSISLNATPFLKSGSVNLNLSSEYAEGVTYVARLYDENSNLIYESEELKAGEGISKIELLKDLSIGKHECALICESFKNENYLGTIESSLTLNVKED